MTPEVEQVRALLVELAHGCNGPDDVAAKLRVVGIRGTKWSSYMCPVAGWLRMHRLGRWRVGGNFVYVTGLPVLSFAMPDELSVFTGKFDHGAYPDLEAT